MFWCQEIYKNRFDWVLLEIKVPRETLKGPKAMDQVLSSVFNLRNFPIGPKEVYWDGEITRWFSLEIVGTNQATRLYLRIVRPLMHPFISSFYAQYPDVEIVEAGKDYIYDYPDTYQALRARNYEIYGLELTQSKDPAYSLRTYVDFETKVGSEKGRIIDPMATVIEIIGKLKPEETVWIQFLCVPDTKHDTKKHWWIGADREINKMKETKQESHGAPGQEPTIRFRFRTQAEEKKLKHLEEKKGKPAFEVTFRSIYIAPRNIFNRDLANRGISSFLMQMNDDEQRIKKINKIRSKVDWDAFPYIFPKRRLFWKNVAIYDEYRRRFIPEETIAGKIYNSYPLRWCFWHKPMILSSEEIATFFHIPTSVVLTQVTMERIESKRLSPPSNIPL